MDKVEICKVQIGTEIYVVNQMCNDAGPVNEFHVTNGKHLVKGGSYFNDRFKAIQFMLRTAFINVSQGVIDFNS